jgi:hypothetical protein
MVLPTSPAPYCGGVFSLGSVIELFILFEHWASDDS